jgi:Holliday junction resolvasome RuvABC endonuclease subunit
MKFAAIDPGQRNLGLVVMESHQDQLRVLDCARVDLTNCADTHIVDRVVAFLSRYATWLEGCEMVVIERQPPGGGGETVAALLYRELGALVRWVSPQTLHRHFSLPVDYERRKERVVAIAREYLAGQPGFEGQARQHDIADALLMGLHFFQLEQERARLAAARARGTPFSHFAYSPASSSAAVGAM